MGLGRFPGKRAFNFFTVTFNEVCAPVSVQALRSDKTSRHYVFSMFPWSSLCHCFPPFPQFFFFVSCHCASLLPPTLLYPPLPFTCQELSGVYGGVLKRQTEFVALCIDHILSLYQKLNLTTSSVPILAHSMVGGGERREGKGEERRGWDAGMQGVMW